MTNIFPISAKLTNSQKNALESGPNVIITGSAGTGKTFLTILLAEKIKSFDPRLSVQIIILTKSLKSFIEKSLKERNIKDVSVNVFASWSNKPRDSDYVILDEVQDLKLSQIEEIASYTKQGFYLLGDSNQIIYNDQLKGASIEEIADRFKFKQIELKEIVRFNKGIKNFISAGYQFLENSIVANDEIFKPKIIRFENDDEQIDEIKKIISNLPKNETTGIFVFLNNDVEKLLQELSSRKVIVHGYKINQDEKLVFHEGAVNILTYHSAKGIEFDNVILPHFDRGHGYPNNIYYVGFSRAKSKLFILYSRNFPAWYKIKDNNCYEGEIDRTQIIKIAEDEFEINFGIYKEVFKDQFNLEQLKIKFQTEFQNAISQAKETLKLSELSDEQIDKIIDEWVKK